MNKHIQIVEIPTNKRAYSYKLIILKIGNKKNEFLLGK